MLENAQIVATEQYFNQNLLIYIITIVRKILHLQLRFLKQCTVVSI